MNSVRRCHRRCRRRCRCCAVMERYQRYQRWNIEVALIAGYSETIVSAKDRNENTSIKTVKMQKIARYVYRKIKLINSVYIAF